MKANAYLDKINYEEDTGLTEKDIATIEREIDFDYPLEYREMIKKFNGGCGNIGEVYIDFWEAADVQSYYDENETLKNFVIFASDGCGVAFAFKRGNSSLEEEYAKKAADNYGDFIKNMYSG